MFFNIARNPHLHEAVSVYNLWSDRASRGGNDVIASF